MRKQSAMSAALLAIIGYLAASHPAQAKAPPFFGGDPFSELNGLASSTMLFFPPSWVSALSGYLTDLSEEADEEEKLNREVILAAQDDALHVLKNGTPSALFQEARASLENYARQLFDSDAQAAAAVYLLANEMKKLP